MDEVTKAELVEFRRWLEGGLAAIANDAGIIKEDDIVDDAACDSVVSQAREIAVKFNAIAPYLGLESISVPEELAKSSNQ